MKDELYPVQNLAQLSLDTLRVIRDKNPNEWDSIMKTESGQKLLALWDHLVRVSKYE
jgi:hypothetical protein